LALVAEDTMKSLFLSLLAFQPAANVVESIFFTARQIPVGPSSVRTRNSGKIISDCAQSTAAFWIAHQADVTGHHRYYGRSAYP
jgi:hypothetical protein